jgi:uncharacterized protein
VIFYLSLGLLLGTIAGLSGAGGAIIGIPLLVLFTGVDIKAATSLILPVVSLAAFLTWLPQRKLTNWALASRMVIPLAISSWLSGYLKPYLPNWTITAALVLFALWGLYQTWKRQKPISEKNLTHFTLKATMTGLATGIVTTLTGLGGGIFMLPIFKQCFFLSQSAAVATSLIVIIVGCFIAMTTLSMTNQFQIFDFQTMLVIGAGISVVSLALREWLKRSTIDHQLKIRKMVYSIVLFFSIIGLLFS